MMQFRQQSGRSVPEQPSKIGLQSQASGLRFWLFLVGGSVLLHFLLIRWVGAMVSSHVSPAAAMPVDLIQLPDVQANRQDAAGNSTGSKIHLSRSQSQAATLQSHAPLTAEASSQATSEPASPQLSAAHAGSSISVLSQPSRTPVTSLAPSGSNRQFATVVPSTVLSPMAIARSAWPANRQPSSRSTPQASPLQASPRSVMPTASPLSSGSIPPPSPSPTTSGDPSSRSIQPSPIASPVSSSVPSPQMPLIASQRITLPVPDLSQSSASNQQLEATAAADQTLVPNYLTANLTAVSLSDDHGADDQRVDSVENPVAESVEADIEQSAQPQIEMQRFLTNSQLPPCAVTPEAVYFLGKTVAMRVTTDAEGQVMQTVTEKSSQNLAYDELASCLVKNWSFKPAIAHGQPAKSDGLVVQITIDRN